MRLFRLSLKDGPSYSDYAHGPLAPPVRPYRPAPAIYVAPPPTPPQPIAPVPTFVMQQSAAPRVSVQVERQNSLIAQSFGSKLPPFNPLLPILLDTQTASFQALPESVKTYQLAPGYGFGVRPIASRVADKRVSMDAAAEMASQYVNGVSLGYGEKNPLNIRTANELISQARSINKAIENPGYTIQEQKGRYVVVPTKAEASVPTPELGPAWRSFSWGRTAGTSVAVGVERSKLPNLQRQLLNQALSLAAKLTGKPPPRLPEIRPPAFIARGQ